MLLISTYSTLHIYISKYGASVWNLSFATDTLSVKKLSMEPGMMMVVFLRTLCADRALHLKNIFATKATVLANEPSSAKAPIH